MPLDEVKKLLAFANKHKVGKVIISGGEACMSSHAKEIFTYIAKKIFTKYTENRSTIEW